METTSSTILQGFRIDALKVFPMRGLIVKPGGAAEHLEPKVMDVLVCLANKANTVATREELLKTVWPRRVAADNQLTRAISELRRTLDHDHSGPSLIETVPKRGYRLLGTIEPVPDDGTIGAGPAASHKPARRYVLSGALLVTGIAAAILLYRVSIESLVNEDTGINTAPGNVNLAAISEVSTGDELAFQHYADGMRQRKIETNRAMRLAELAFREALARDPDFFEARLELGYTYWELQRVGEISQADARALLQPLLSQLWDQAPDNGLVLALDTFVRYREISDFDSREDRLIAAIARAPDEPRLYRNLARLLTANNRKEDALEWLDRGLTTAPDDWDLHAARGRLLLAIGQNESAGASLKTALVLNPDNPTLLGNLAKIAMLQGDYVEWFSAWLRAMEVAPHDDEIPAYVALQLYTLGLGGEADEFLQRAFVVNPRRSWSRVPQLYSRLVAGDPAGAHELARNMLAEKQENRWGAHDIALTVFVSTGLELGMTESASQLLEQLTPGIFSTTFEPGSPAEAIHRKCAILLQLSDDREILMNATFRVDGDSDVDIALAAALGEQDAAVSMALKTLSSGLAIDGYKLPYLRFRYLKILDSVASDPRVANRLYEIDEQGDRAAEAIRTFISQANPVR